MNLTGSKLDVDSLSLSAYIEKMRKEEKGGTDVNYQFDVASKLRGLLKDIDLMGTTRDSGPEYLKTGFLILILILILIFIFIFIFIFILNLT